ncbi:Rieske (2Fe-2S) protein [Kordiimonas gwangyangensis]|uniref:Rieske (2Fe-2S) protein n=1 Tax=Kordiimonas gwangyangensis TaxID=288022 RepID=UPI00037B9B44|nr:Rieske 2Fe-2S domain-containing protein [Kordiimonas gwangyangensis]
MDGSTANQNQPSGKNLVNLGPVPELRERGRAVLKVKGRQIALFETDGKLFAINNRCPHEGYPLVEGSLKKGCQLACNWHGWTFDLASGKALQGRDAVKTYAVTRVRGDILIDLAPEDPSVLRARAYGELDEALAEHDYDRIARSLARLEAAGEEVENTLRHVISLSVHRFERGFGHAFAGLADWLAFSAHSDQATRRVALLEAIGHISWDMLMGTDAPLPRLRKRWSAKACLEALEDMNEEEATAHIRGAFDEGLGFQAVKPVFEALIFAHYAGFGHPAIYLMKAEQLIDALGQEVAEPLALSLARYLCHAAREDLIPEFKGFADYLALEPGFSPVPKVECLSGQSVRQVFALTAASNAHVHEMWEALLAASAMNMLRFDIERQHGIAQPIAQNIGWLDFTHAITFAEAVHFHGGRNAALWQSGLTQMAAFVGRNAPFLMAEMDEGRFVDDIQAFLGAQKAKLFNMDEGDYIYAVHRLKMLRATEALLVHVSKPTARLIVAALNRYLHARTRQRHPARTAFQAWQTVARES